VSDNCDHNFGTFDDFGVKNDQKVSNNMILMSKYKGKHGGKKGQKIRAWVGPPPTFGQCPKENVFFEQMSSLRKSRSRCIDKDSTPPRLLPVNISVFKLILYIEGEENNIFLLELIQFIPFPHTLHIESASS
jgi:hypothetical protein